MDKKICLCMPFGEGLGTRNNNDDFFKSVASATALQAGTIHYLYVPEYNTKISVFKSRLKAVRNYMRCRGQEVKIVLHVYMDEKYDRKKQIDNELIHAKNRRYVDDYHVKYYKDQSELIGFAMECALYSEADYYDGTCMLVNSPSINGQVATAVSKVLSYFEFDSYNRKFINCVNCDWLRSEVITSYITVEDMFSLMNACDKEVTEADCEDIYLNFWDIYSGEGIHEPDFFLCARSWTKLCAIISYGGIDNLSIVKRPMNASDSREERVITQMLNAMFGRGFIQQLRIEEASEAKGRPSKLVSLKVKETRLKDVCSKAGNMLELYVYYEACKIGWFDDVKTGYKFRWEFDDVTNELDCVLTKGFRSILVECKSTKSPDETFFLTLDSLGDHFGIGYKKVLIMVTDVRETSYETYRSRGRQMDIILISSKEDLRDIGSILKRIMEQ